MEAATPNGQGTDHELVARARDGDSRAMDRLVSRHHGSVFRVALLILKDEDLAADAAQEAFIKALRGLKDFRGEASFRTWLLTIAANEARGLLRKRGRRREQALDATPPVSAEERSAEDELVRNEELREIRDVLDTLPEKQRQAVALRVFEGLSFREVGELIGSSEGAARVNYHHGIRRIRETLA